MLTNFPIVSEQTSITGDRQPSENASLNCVPASLCAGAMYLNNKPLGGIYTPDDIKDKVYGQGYRGGTAARAYIDYMHSGFGIKLWSYASNRNSELVQEVHAQLQQGFPVLFTEPNPYGNPNYTHVCVFCGEDNTGLTAMDPWVAKFLTRSDVTWTNTLIDNEIWIMEYTMRTPNGWYDDGTTLYGPDKKYPIVLGFRNYILTHRWDPTNWPLEKEVAANPIETSNPALGNGTRQTFRKSILEWTPQLGVFEGWIGQEMLKVRQDLLDCQAKNKGQQ